ncbi:NtaA/DmoA family FMN-dependent monooxygenase [Leucobacter musarum]|uniref:NtaA/DmoA family FMN-dependent monooxygenase n=1 Tax=Leucobacter musarum TaxID=1930747 RepID=UPI0006A7DA2E|nr:NtaA/DmoA family FMN-dependent monooxygenase [Leucobacter musarum]
MTSSPRQVHLNLLVSGFGTHGGAWLHPSAQGLDPRDLEHYVRIAETAERGTFDALLFADAPALGAGAGAYLGNPFEPITLLAALAARTSHIGLIPTASTTFNEPYNLARFVASLDLISGGRAGWNAVTTSNLDAARNFGLDAHLAHEVRYKRADEFIAVVQQLWHSWERGAVDVMPEQRQQVRPGSVHRIEHAGEIFSVEGALNVPPSPQGRPVQVQAGGSGAGIRLGARYAELVYANAGSLESSRAFLREFKETAASYGRDPEHIAIAPGVVPFVAGTEEEARRVKREIEAGIDVAALLPEAEKRLFVDLSGFDLDAPFPAHLLPDVAEATNSIRTYAELRATLQAGDYTVREALLRVSGGSIHREFVGSVEQFAGELETWFAAGAADGFTLMPPLVPDQLDALVDGVVPILRERGLFREAYEATTLRGHYGIPEPEAPIGRARERVPA